jgi:LysM repeat protein
MATYTVSAGDTLSGIGSKLGIDWKSLSGYKSGDPNLIYPGEVLSYGSSSTTATKPKSTTTVAPLKTTTPAPGSSAALTNELTKMDSAYQNPVDVYNKALSELGITDARTRLTDLRQSLINNQNLLDSLSGNIQSRTANSLVTEAQRQRLYATEAEPITQMGNRLNQQYGTAQQDVQDITSQAGTQTQLFTEGQKSQREALLNRLQLAIDKETNAEKKRQWQAEFDRQRAMDQQTIRDADRQYQLALSKFNYDKTSDTESKSNYNYTTSKAGGYNFYKDGKAITGMDYVRGQGGNIYDLQNLLSKSKDKGDAKIVNDIANGLSATELKKKYPWVF